MSSSTLVTSFSILSFLLSSFQPYWPTCCCTGCPLIPRYHMANSFTFLTFAQLSPSQWSLLWLLHFTSQVIPPALNYSFLSMVLISFIIFNSVLTCYIYLINASLACRKIIGTQWVLSIYLSIEHVNIKWINSFFPMFLRCIMIELIRLHIFLILILWIYYFHKSSTFCVPWVWMFILQYGSPGCGSLVLLSWLEHVVTYRGPVSTSLFCSHFCLCLASEWKKFSTLLAWKSMIIPLVVDHLHILGIG